MTDHPPPNRADPYPARLHVFFASETPQALVIRRGPSRQVATIGWDRKTDTFTLGQWLKGKIYEDKCDLSPDGKYFLYFAMGKGSWITWTALSKAPYLKALDFHAKSDTWGGGGLFLSNQSYWLSNIHRQQFKCSQLELTSSDNPIIPPDQKEYIDPYVYRLIRGGWKKGSTQISEIKEEYGPKKSPYIYETNIYLTPFQKQFNQFWQLVKWHNIGGKIILGKGSCYDTHQLINTQTNETLNFKDWEWADIDNSVPNRSRLVFAEKGKLKAINLDRNNVINLERVVELYDFNNMTFQAIKAPYDAPELSREEFLNL